MSGELIKNVLIVELVISSIIFLISLYELIGVWNARRRRLTKNISRLISYLAICLISIALCTDTFSWMNYITYITEGKWQEVTFINWPFLLISISMGFLIFYEFTGIYYAKKNKLTKNISRLITHFVMLCLFCLLIFLSIKRWNIYLEILKQPALIKNSPPHVIIK